MASIIRRNALIGGAVDIWEWGTAQEPLTIPRQLAQHGKGAQGN
jgi:hypothetical protein